MKGIWITWEKQRRNKGIANSLNYNYYEFDESVNYPNDLLGKIQRYFFSTYLTVKAIKKEDPAVVIVQIPSIILGYLAFFFSKNKKLIFDLHNHPAEVAISNLGFKAKLYRFILSKADYIIVTNTYLEQRLRKILKKSNFLILPDSIPQIDRLDKIELISKVENQDIVTVISSFSDDEPIEEIIKALNHFDSIIVFITGKKSKANELLKYQSNKINFTDFLTESDYEALIQHSDLLIDLTTREDCLVCGAYEALAVGKPIIISDTFINRQTFKGSFFFTKSNAENISIQIERFLNDKNQVHNVNSRDEFLKVWNRQLAEVKITIEGLEN